MHGHQPHPTTPISDDAFLIKRGKKRGNYNCGRCGLPKKGHKCPYENDAAAAVENDESLSTPVSTPAAAKSSALKTVGSATAPRMAVDGTPTSVVRTVMPATRRRALSFVDVSVADSMDELHEEKFDLDEDEDICGMGELTPSCLWEVLRRLPPKDLLSAAGVCRGWRETSRKVWRAAEELQIRVPAKSPIAFVGSVLKKCPELIKLSLRIESDVDATILACIAFSCPDLQVLEIFTSDSAINRISGDELSRFVSDKRCLTVLKMEGCSNLGGFVFSSTSLSTIWLSDLHSLSKMVFNCPNLKEVSLDFSCRGNDSTDITAALDSLGRSCPKLQSIYVASTRLSHAAVLALSDGNMRGLRMLSLVLGAEINDASVAAIACSFPKLELLDLSGSSMSDSGLGMICNIFPETLSKFLLALCPNITTSGIQFAAGQLPNLELMDCGKTICDPNSENASSEDGNDSELQKTPNSKMHLTYQKLIIKHNRLQRLSLWGCTGLDALYLNCPHLIDLNLNSCRNLHPERLLLQCPNLENVHASDCDGILVKTIKSQVNGGFSSIENHFAPKRLPDGSKRIGLPYFCSPPPSEEKKRTRPAKRRRCEVIDAL